MIALSTESVPPASDAVRIVASSRDGNLRIALHLYTTEDDIAVVLAALRRHRSLLA